MLQNGQRVCDVCNATITKGTRYQHNRMPAQSASLLTADQDPDLTPSWTTNADGTISMDICATCSLSMDVNRGKNEVN
jgi:hypothetical protein